MATELILVRHGNAVRVNGDYFYAPLTQLGREQAAETGEYFASQQNHLDGFYASPIRRAQETASIIGAKIKSIRWPIEGRVSAVLLEIVGRHPDQRVGVISHAGAISAALAWYLPENRWHWWRATPGNCSITRIRVEGSRAVILAENDTRHLSPVVITTQPPTKTVEIAKAAVTEKKALDTGATTDKKE